MEAPRQHSGIMSFPDIRRWLVDFEQQLSTEGCSNGADRVDLALKLLDDAQKLGIENRVKVLR